MQQDLATLYAQPGPTTTPAPAWGKEVALLRSPAPVSDEALAEQCVLDTAERTSTGTFIYPAIWVATALATDAGATWPWLMWGNAIGLALLAMVRTAYTRQLRQLLRDHGKHAEWGFNAQYLLNALYWSCLTAICITVAPLQPLTWTLLIGSACIVAAGNTMLGINPKLRRPFLLVIFTPMMIAKALTPLPPHLMLLALQCILVPYLSRTSQLVYQDYWDGRHARRLAEQQARELELASLTDGLTQAPNRMYFDRQLAHEWARHCRSGAHLSVLLVDLDHFKNINDSFGHLFGDTCLKAAAQALQHGCGRSSDFVARYGGEEFVVLLPDTDAAGARTVAEQMLEQVRALLLRSDGLDVRLTCSIGVASVKPSHDGRPTDLVQHADDALYEAKHGGRNRAVQAAELPSTSH